MWTIGDSGFGLVDLLGSRSFGTVDQMGVDVLKLDVMALPPIKLLKIFQVILERVSPIL